MNNQQLSNYIKNQTEKGKSKEEIKESLLSAGWKEDDVNEALGVSDYDQAPSPPPEEKTFSSTGLKQLDPKAVWSFFLRFMAPFFGLLVFPILMIIIPIIEPGAVHEFNLGALLIIFIVILFLGSSFSYIWAKLTYKYYRYELDEEDFRKESGVIFKKYTTIPYERIQNINIQRGIIDRMLGLSSLKIFTAGSGGSGAAGAEGLLPGLSEGLAEEIRDELANRSRKTKRRDL